MESKVEYGVRPADAEPKPPRQFVGFGFYKLDSQFLRETDPNGRVDAVHELASVVADAQKRFLIYPFSTLGTRAEADFLLWKISYRLEDFDELAAAIRATRLGRYLSIAHNFLSMTKTSIYVDDHVHEDQDATRNRIAVSGRKYLFVYPFVKTRQWYLLPKEERQRVMREHIRLGHKYPSVKLNTTYSFGLDDQDFVVAFESDHPDDFLDLVQDLRETESSLFTQRDTPILTCIKLDAQTIFSRVAGVVCE